MFKHVDGRVLIEMPAEAEDAMTIALLKAGRESIVRSIDDTVDTSMRMGSMQPHRTTDLMENLRLLDAFNAILEYYGVRA